MSHRPTDLELMQYADGELEEARAAEVRAWLEGSARGRAIVASIGEIGLQVREQAERTAAGAGADSIVGSVMARVDQDPASPADGPGAGGRVLPIEAARRQPSFGAYAMAGLALAAAAALVVWQLADPAGTPQGTSPSVLPLPSDSTLMVASAATPSPDTEDREPGVSVDAIEFGAHSGTIFYVPTDTGTTTVVWLTDDETGEER